MGLLLFIRATAWRKNVSLGLVVVVYSAFRPASTGEEVRQVMIRVRGPQRYWPLHSWHRWRMEDRLAQMILSADLIVCCSLILFWWWQCRRVEGDQDKLGLIWPWKNGFYVYFSCNHFITQLLNIPILSVTAFLRWQQVFIITVREIGMLMRMLTAQNCHLVAIT